MKKFLKVLSVAVFTLAIASPLNAEVFESTYDVEEWVGDYKPMIDMLIGPGVASHPSGKKLPQTREVQVGVFSNLVAGTIFSFTNGIILSTGKIANGKSLVNEKSNYEWPDDKMYDTDPDPDLEGYFPEWNLYDPAGIILYIQPTNRTINIPFVMASEEFFFNSNSVDYPTQEEYEDFSDKFAFFLKPLGDVSSVTDAEGNVIDTSTDMRISNTGTHSDWMNIVQLPEEAGGGDVEIVSVNQHTNATYFISNIVSNEYGDLIFPATDIKLPMEFNGAIVGPVAVAENLDTNKIYKLKIVIADCEDKRLNSVVFLRGRGITSGADLKIDVSGPTALAESGEAVFTDTVSNIGPATADGVEVKHYLPEGVDTGTVSIDCGGVGSVGGILQENGTNYFVWTIGDRFKPESNAVMTVTCTLPAQGTYTNLATVVTSTGDYDEGNNTDKHVTTVGALPKLTISAISTNKVYGTEFSLPELQFILSIEGTNGTQQVSGIDVSFTNALGEAVDPKTAGAPVGTYGINLSGIRGFDLSVFGDRIEYVPGTMTITPAPLVIVADDAERAYGEALAFGGTEFTTVPASLPNGEQVATVTISSG